MVSFRDEHILVIQPGSQTTQAQLGLGESLGPASITIPSRVYQHPDHLDQDYFSATGDESKAIYPISKGRIINLSAFKYLIKLVYKSALKASSSSFKPAILLVTNGRFGRLAIEEITKYVFESIGAPAFSTLPIALAASFAYASQDALVIDIGKDKTEITPILDYTVITHAQDVVDVGGQTINESLSKLLPDLSPNQVESLKKSPIYEVLSADEHKNSWFALNQTKELDEDDEGVVDIAAIVTSGRTREILAEREKSKQDGTQNGENEPPNMDRELNTFVDDDGKTIEVGKQRFHGTETLVDRIITAVGIINRRIDVVNRRQDLWDNIIIVGKGSKVSGLKEAIIAGLQERYLVSRASSYPESSGFNSSYNSPAPTSLHTASNQGHGQSPSSMKMLRMADYFPEWKGLGWEDVPFLGAQIAAKQLFTGAIDNGFVSRSEYNDTGPSAIWDI